MPRSSTMNLIATRSLRLMTGLRPRQGESSHRRDKEAERDENLSQIDVNKKGTLPLLIYSKKGGNLLQLPMWDYSQGEEGVAHLEGGGPSLGAMAHGGGLPLPLMGPK